MGYRPTSYYSENAGGERMHEGWNTAVPTEIRYIDTKNGPATVVKWKNDDGQVATDFLYETDMYGSNARIAALAEIAGINWAEEISGEDFANLLNTNLFKVAINIKYGKGDMAFIQEYKPMDNAPAKTPMPTPQPAKTAAPATAKRRF
jgi:hypothetical protein